MEYGNLLELLMKRRSIRSFKTDPISDDHIRNIVGTVRWAPSAKNTQPWDVVVIKKQELKDSIVEFFEEEMKGTTQKMPPKDMPGKPGQKPPSTTGFADAPVFILLLGDTRIKDFMPPIDEDRWASVFTSSLALGFHNMLLAASTFGLGAQWVSAVANPGLETRIKELLGIPDVMNIYAMMALGYPNMEPAPKKMREVEKMVRYDHCSQNDFRTDEEVKRFLEK